MDQETMEMFKRNMASEAKLICNPNVEVDDEINNLKAYKMQQEILNDDQKALNEKAELDLKFKEFDLKLKELDFKKDELKQKEKESKRQTVKDVVAVAVPAVLRCVSFVAVGVITKNIIGAQMMMEYQDNMIPPKSIGDGSKFLAGILTKI